MRGAGWLQRSGTSTAGTARVLPRAGASIPAFGRGYIMVFEVLMLCLIASAYAMFVVSLVRDSVRSLMLINDSAAANSPTVQPDARGKGIECTGSEVGIDRLRKSDSIGRWQQQSG
jgi:hypothetical protein